MTASMSKLHIEQVDLKGKRVLLRADFNVPQDKEGRILNNRRIVAALETIKHALGKSSARSVVLVSHLGRPEGQINARFSLKPVAEELRLLLKRDVTLLHDCVGPDVEKACANPPHGSLLLLENLRFHIEEEGEGTEGRSRVRAEPRKMEEFQTSLSRLGDVYVNDAFDMVNRNHSSVTGIRTPVRATGFLVKKELDAFAKILEKPDRPVVAIMGGAKLQGKVKVIENLLDKVTDLIISGGMAFTFLKVWQQMEIGVSMFDEEGARSVPGLIEKASKKKVNLHLPVDFIIGDKFDEKAAVGAASTAAGIPANWVGLDIGVQSVTKFATIIRTAKTLFWNGPVGVYEWPNFATGTKTLMEYVAEATKRGCTTVITGNDTAAACLKFGAENQVSHCSSGGGASLEMLEGKVLPGIAHLSNAP